MSCHETLKWKAQGEWEGFWREESAKVSEWKSRTPGGRRRRRYQSLGGPSLWGKDDVSLQALGACGDAFHQGLVSRAWAAVVVCGVWLLLQDSMGTSSEVLECQPPAKRCIGYFGRANILALIRSVASGWERLAAKILKPKTLIQSIWWRGLEKVITQRLLLKPGTGAGSLSPRPVQCIVISFKICFLALKSIMFPVKIK